LADAPPEATTPPAKDRDDLAERLQSALGDAYAVEGRLGAGGFAVVYLVRDVHLKRKLAVKVLSPDLIASHSVLERFRREAETVAQLSHPNIVPLHFIGQKDDLVYLVMEAIGGGSLSDRLQREKQLPIEEAARIFSEVASALAHAHKRGVVHRDIKPQNVLLDAESGRALVTDFGIARTAEGGSLTATGMVVGTPAYLSPEQVTGEPSDHRADIYALGVMMYEMLAGQPPFTGATPTAVLMKRLGGAPPPLKGFRAEIPPALEELVDACLATDPNDRIQNAADITRALTGHSPVSGGHTTSTHLRVKKKQPAARSKATMIAIAAAALVAVVTSIAALMKDRAEPPPVPVAVAAVNPGMVLIPAGTYTIGANDEEVARPAHAMPVSAFGIDTLEVTVAEYGRFVATGVVPAPWASRPDSVLPVTGVRLAEAQSFCNWKHPGGGRLPTEEEWEAAARGIEGRRYPWGKAWVQGAANVGRAGPAPVGSYPLGRTPEGVRDLVGNVWEWTGSAYHPYSTNTAADPALYVIRGGAHNSLQTVANAVFRGRSRIDTERSNLAATGFRCAMPARK
jgi:formylglycine-generating enzyme required for sulfatase activity/tRNA A-37 threonylcarbamoyl transferase component Bud32